MTTDMKAAESFYKTVVGWTSEPFAGASHPYTALNRSGADGNVGIGGIMERPAEMKAPPFWAMYVAVPKLEDAVAQITRRGGKPHTDVISIPNVGRMQLMMDPQGAAFYIIEPASSEQRPEGAAEVGDTSWHELMTTDPDGALQFYQDVFHWQADEAMDMGEMGKYQIFKRPTAAGRIGGIMKKPAQMANVPSNWQLYFRVPDVDAAAERIKQAGGQVINGPMDVPDGDRVLNALDPQGAAFGLHSKKS
jgi:predicted enzyme related to lactoylglutathione lyase